jgi:hypothetical protein
MNDVGHLILKKTVLKLESGEYLIIKRPDQFANKQDLLSDTHLK